MKSFNELLIELDACEQAIHWAGDMTIEEVVKECHRGDWLLWLAGEIQIDHRRLTLAKGHCANTVRHLMDDKRSIKAVDTAIAYGEGKASIEELSDAADAAYAAAAAAYAAYAAAAADAACASADDAAETAYAAYAAAAADAACASADDAASRNDNRKQTADISRKYIGQEIIDKVNELLK